MLQLGADLHSNHRCLISSNTPHPSRRCAPIHLLPQGEKGAPICDPPHRVGRRAREPARRNRQPRGIRFAAWSSSARRLWVSIFDKTGSREIDRLELQPEGEGVHALFVAGLGAGTRYGFRADGDYAPDRGFWFDPEKLLVDPYAVEIDRPYAHHWRLAARRNEGADTAPLMPKAVAKTLPKPLPVLPPLFRPGGLVYEVPVRAFTMQHPDIPESQRGKIAALAHPAIIEHLKKSASAPSN
ncbi:hypothetical protein AJ88_08790 [Mesorhizobium amorphae CCBAU 01583]|nr:hypothetical protein AJ88_08790 [Mesorhizobium amorphae CCBAU 01583]